MTETAPEESATTPATDWLEVATTVLISLAAVLIAWAAYQGALWGGVQDTANTESVLAIVNAADEFGRADGVASLDQLLFVDYIAEVQRDPNSPVAGLLLDQMSDAGYEATQAWFENDELRPFDDATYLEVTYADGNDLYESGIASFDEATTANSNGDDYERWSTVMALVLFLGGLSLVIDMGRVRMVLIALSGVVLIWAAIALIGLPTAP